MTNPKNKCMQLRLPENLKQDLDLLASLRDVPTSQLIREALREFLARQKEKGRG
jgi:predicted transcriptional regulator